MIDKQKQINHAKDERNMPKYFYLIFFILILFFGILIGLQSAKTIIKKNITTAHPTLQLIPSQTAPDSKGNVHIQVLLHGQNAAMGIVHFTLFYDPQSLQLQTIQPAGAFANAQVLQKTIDDKGYRCCHDTGKIQYTIKRTGQQATDNIVVAMLEFHALRQKGQTGIHFIDAQINDQEVAKEILLKSQNNVLIRLRADNK